MTGPGWRRSRCASSVSIMGLPTKTTRSPLMPSAARLTSPFGRRHEERVAEQVGDAPVDLLGHRRVEGAQAGLHVRHRDEQLGADERRRQRGVDVAVDDDAVRRSGPGRLCLERHSSAAVWAAWLPEPTPEVQVRLGQAELLEEDVGQAAVVVLAGVDEALLDARRPERGDDGRGLDEVRPRADDVDEPGHAGKDATSARVGEP